jgi:hypothetical protein
MVALSAPALAEQKSLTYVVKMGPVISKSDSASPQPEHKVINTVRKGTTSSADSDWDGTSLVNYGTSDFSGGKGTVQGFAVRTHKNGDQTFYTYRGNVKVVGDGDPPPTSGEGTVQLIGGTGRYSNAKGSGTWVSEQNQSRIKLDVQY